MSTRVFIAGVLLFAMALSACGARPPKVSQPVTMEHCTSQLLHRYRTVTARPAYLRTPPAVYNEARARCLAKGAVETPKCTCTTDLDCALTCGGAY